MVDFSEDRHSFLSRLLKNLPNFPDGQAEEPTTPAEPVTMYWEGTGRGFPGAYIASELWTLQQWARLDPEDRPEDAGLIPGLGWIRIRKAPRAEAMFDVCGPEPEPVDVEVVRGKHATIFRYWRPGEAATCRRCARCNIGRSGSRPGLDMCMTPFDDDEPDDDGSTADPAPDFDEALVPSGA